MFQVMMVLDYLSMIILVINDWNDHAVLTNSYTQTLECRTILQNKIRVL